MHCQHDTNLNITVKNNFKPLSFFQLKSLGRVKYSRYYTPQECMSFTLGALWNPRTTNCTSGKKNGKNMYLSKRLSWLCFFPPGVKFTYKVELAVIFFPREKKSHFTPYNQEVKLLII
jgi:hypothetical protein